MSLNSYDAGEDFISVSPRAFTLENCIITSNDGNEVEIKDLVQDVKIHESLNRSSIIVEIFVNDAANLIFHMKLAGNEKVSLLISRLEPGDIIKEFSLLLNITDITNFAETSPSSQSYTLICMSKHVYLDKEKLLNIPFDNTANILIKNIVNKNLKSEIDVRASTKNSMTGIYPNISPLNAISWLLRNSFDDNTEVYFYESASEGLILTSHKQLMSQNLYEEYNRIPFNTQTTFNSQPGEVFKEERLKIIKFQSSLNLSKLDKVESGAFGSSLNTIDIATKTVDNTLDYSYKFDKNKSLNDVAPINNKMTIGDKKLNEWKKYKQYYVSKNSLAFGNKKNYHEPVSKTLLESTSRFQNLDTTKLKMIIPGDFDITPGKIISIIAPLQADVTFELAEGEQFIDGFVTGKYLVSTITHHFSSNDGYTSTLNLKKDSFIKQYEEK